MASLIQWLKFSGARKSNGDAVASGTISFYVPGSTTEEADVFADSAETTPLTQPVSLDAGGRAEVFIGEKAQYLVKDSTGATVHGVDTDPLNVENGTPSSTVEIASGYWYSSGDVLGDPTTVLEIVDKLGVSLGLDAQYQENVANPQCAPRNYVDVLHNCVRSKDYGAVGDNSADDTTNLQRAINRAIATGLPLYLEPGQYRTTFPLSISGSIFMFGNGKDVCQIIGESSVNGLNIDAGASGSVKLRDFLISVPLEADGPVAITVDSALSLEVTNVEALGRIGFDSSVIDYARFNNCYATSLSGSGGGTFSYGFSVGDYTNLNACVANCVDTDYTENVGISVGKGCKVIGCHVSSFGKGFLANDVQSLAIACSFVSCEYAVDAQFAGSGAAFCTGTGNTTSILTGTAEGAVNFGNLLTGIEHPSNVDPRGAWYSDRFPVTKLDSAVALPTGTETFTPKVNGAEYKVARGTYAGTTNLTVAAPTNAAGGAITPRDGSTMQVVLQAASGNTIAVTWNAIFIGGASANVSASTYRIQKFVYKSATSNWVAVNAGETLSGDAWA